jgi:hypothetical protein
MKEIFRYCDGNLQVFMDTPRKIRLLDNQNNPQWMQLNWPTLQGVINDVSQGEYDFTASTVELGETARQVKFAEAMDFVKTIPPQLVKWDELFKLWDSPVADVMGQFAAQMLGIGLQQQAQGAMQQQQQNQLQNVQGAASAIGALNTTGGASPDQELARESAQAQQLGAGQGSNTPSNSRAMIPNGMT